MRRNTGLTAAVLLVLAGGAGFWLLTHPANVPAGAFRTRIANLANGETLFNVGGCASCHKTPNQKVGTQLGGGLAMKTEFGTFRVPNISPHPEFGIGRWSERDFANAMLKGVGNDGEHLYPSFPYTSYQRMPLDDVRDLHAYIKTLPPVASPSLAHDLSFPYSFRRGLGIWKMLYLDGRQFYPSQSLSAEINRGAYLVEGPGHCAECHSPRNAFGGIPGPLRFAGGPPPEGKGWVPNITPHPDGLADWTAGDMVTLLELGMTPDGDFVGSTMADVVENTGKLTATDRRAMAAYLKTLPPRPNPPKPEPATN